MTRSRADGEWRWHRTRRGRPPTRGETASVRVTVRFTPREIKIVRDLIGRTSLSKWLVNVALRAARGSR